MNRLVGRRFGAALLLIAFAIGALWLGRFLAHRGLEWAAKFSEVASFVLAVAGVLAAPFGKITQWLRGPQPPTLEQIASAASRLRAALTAALDTEGSEVYEDQPMQVRFGPWAEFAAAQVSLDTSSPDVPTADQPLAGDFGSVVEAFSREPRFRRVVLGEAGAGKSVLVAELQRRLLSASEPDAPVPVVVPVGAWRPDKQSLLDWLADRLAVDHAWLPVTHARALVVSSKVLPILDGLDEMPRTLQSAAIARINEHRVYRPLVVTSREEQYLDAIRQNRDAIKDAPVVAIRPLLAANIRAYLDPSGNGPWAEVLARIDTNGPLAGVLANPLMLWLARVVYRDESPDNLASFSTRTSLENHLLDQFVPAVYEGERRWPPLRGFHCTGWQAEHWLGALVYGRRTKRQADQDRRADDRGTMALEWWRFGAAAGWWWRALGIALRTVVLSIVAAALFVWVLARQGNWRHGAYSGPVNFGHLLLGGRAGQLIRPTVQHLAQPFPKGTGRQVQAGFASAFQAIDYVFSHPLLFIAVAVLFALAMVGLTYPGTSGTPCRLQIRIIPALTHALMSCAVIFVMTMVGSLLILHLPRHQISTGAFFNERSTWVTLFAISLLGLTSIPSSFTKLSDISSNLSPPESLRLDRQADAVVTVSRRSAIAVTVWLFCGPQVAAAYGIIAVTATIVALTLGGHWGYASRSYIDARIWLALGGRLPWRTMTFLADASHRGVLRQAGATYQFRHVRLQEQAGNWRSVGKPRLVDRWVTLKARLTEASDLIGQRSGARPPSWAALDELCEEAAKLRRIARTSPDSLPPGFRDDLDDLASRLLNAPGETALAGRILLDAYQTLAETDPVAFKPGLAKVTNSLAGIFPRYEALGLREDAVGEYRELVAGDPATFLPGLHKAVRGLADQLAQHGRAEDALHTVRDLVDTCHGLAETNATVPLAVLAESLSDLADRVWPSRPEESLARRREAAAIYRKLADEDPVKYESRLALSLDTLASNFRELEKPEEELAAVRDAIGAHRKRAEHIAAVRRQIERLTIVPNDARVRYKEVRGQYLVKSLPAESLPTLVYAARDLAIEMDTAGRRREALTFVRDASSVQRSHQSWQYDEPMVVPQWETSEEPAINRMAALALRLWKLGEQQEAPATARITRELAPAGRLGANAPTRIWSTRLIIRSWQASGRGRQREDARFWRRIARQNHSYQRLSTRKDRSGLGLLGATQQLCAQKLEWLSDRFDTLAFRRQVTDRDADALTSARRAVILQRWAVSIYRRMCYRLYVESDWARSLDALAFRLQAAGQPEAAADATSEAGEIRDLL